MLKLNDSKTQFMMLGTKRNLEKAEACTTFIKIGDDEINNVMSVRDVGFHLDKELKSGMHVNKLTSALFITIKKDSKHATPIRLALVLSKLDYCNSLLRNNRL